MPKVIETPVYTYEELDEAAKEQALNWFAEGIFDYGWWDHIYDDAAQIGLKITAFDLDRNKHADGHFINSARNVANTIIAGHGKETDTFKAAQAFLKGAEQIAQQEWDAPDDMNDFGAAFEELEEDFRKQLLEAYATMLQNESEWMLSREYLEEGILANEYTFTANGKRFG